MMGVVWSPEDAAMTATAALPRSLGDHLRAWRKVKRMSQLDLALEAEISARHLSFIETGRSRASREMVLRLAEQLEAPPRQANAMLVAAGYAPVFSEHALTDPALGEARKMIELILESQKPYPAFALDRGWNIVASNSALPELFEGVSEALMTRPVNAMRISLHPDGLAPRIVNLAEWREHLLSRLRRQVAMTADPVVSDLLDEITAYPMPKGSARPTPTIDHGAVAVPLRIQTRLGVLSFLSTTTVFGTPLDVTLSELALELFFAADVVTDMAVRRSSGVQTIAAA
jgi:transcriptional regulator with XRE-family HTH domain